ncbi:MAG: biotin transporter BioY [Candidatus Cardinium sp.]|uniref:biotin transporter BioY n=1 Tax=Cardinium endosymbiont of Dermatophagoides farinae TaxID=2597823 RepID=UPI0011833EDF|nr:biotin transporter BioY [Cardinium endosymbiont of Dermatophagoides farinae]TSJ80802.1 biotin transporter BioY [Cardinium endosymbiont of Dermatophagoides farinae]UWW96805.1 MAG: biotin transporter BioY [Candidatus Cardinium sp.]
MSTKDIVYTALFAAIFAVLGIIPPIPLPFSLVPITAQSLGPTLAGSILGAKRGALAALLFIIIVSTGLPIIAGGHGGIGRIMGPTGGFILGFPIAAFIIGLLFEKNWNRLNLVWAALYIILGGIIVLYIFGLLWLNILFDIQLYKAFVASCIFIPGDLIKTMIAATASMVVRRAYPLIRPLSKRNC